MNKYGLPTMGDPRTIDQYKDFGDWGQNRGKGTLDALANLLGIFGNISTQAKEDKEKNAYKSALLNEMKSQGILPAFVPNKIDTSGIPIPYKETITNPFSGGGSSDAYPSTTKEIGLNLDEQKNAQPSNLDEKTMFAPAEEMGISGLLDLMARKQVSNKNNNKGSNSEPIELKNAKFTVSQLQTKQLDNKLSDEETARLDYAWNIIRGYGGVASEEQAYNIASKNPERFPETEQKGKQKTLEMKFGGKPETVLYPQNEWALYNDYDMTQKGIKAMYNIYVKSFKRK